MKYEKPDLEDLELALEGSFLTSNSTGIDIDDSDETDEID